MSDTYELTIAGLLRKRAIMAAEVQELRRALNDRIAQLDHLDATIRIFKPEIDECDLPERIIPPPCAAKRGEMFRVLMDTLRRAGAPQTTTQLAQAVMQHRQLNTADRVLAKLISKRAGTSLRKLAKTGAIQSRRYGTGAELQWWFTGRGRGSELPGGWRNGSG